MKQKNVTVFEQKVYDLCTQIPAGRVSTYKEIAHALGKPGHAYRAVGRALHQNPFAPSVPCHRVIASDGTLGGFAHGCEKKKQLLSAEGIEVLDGKIIDFERVLYRFRT